MQNIDYTPEQLDTVTFSPSELDNLFELISDLDLQVIDITRS